jgi:hypothetical protein
VGLGAGLDAMAKREYLCPCQKSHSGRLTRSLVNYTGMYVRVCIYIYIERERPVCICVRARAFHISQWQQESH